MRAITRFASDDRIVEEIKFKFEEHECEGLSNALWLHRTSAAFRSLPEGIRKRVNQVQSAASMLEHEFAQEANFPGKANIEEKRNGLYASIIDLLDRCDSELEKGEPHAWVESNLLNILFHPPLAPVPLSWKNIAKALCRISFRSTGAESSQDSDLNSKATLPPSAGASIPEVTSSTASARTEKISGISNPVSQEQSWVSASTEACLPPGATLSTALPPAEFSLQRKRCNSEGAVKQRKLKQD